MKRTQKLINILAVTLILLTLLALPAVAQEPGATADTPAVSAAKNAGSVGWAYVAAGVSMGFGCLGAGVAVAHVGAAAVGSVTEKPEAMARTLIFVGLAEGIAIYGLIIAIMVLSKV